MEKNPLLRKYLAVGIILLFVCGALMPACSAQINTPQANRVTTSSESSVRKVTHTNNDNPTFFDIAIIWGTFEVRWWVSPFHHVVVYNNAPWYNRTMNVIGYESWTGNWTVKKSYWIECNYRHVGIVGRNWLFVIGWGNVAAFG